jgi:hypothetical protein
MVGLSTPTDPDIAVAGRVLAVLDIAAKAAGVDYLVGVAAGDVPTTDHADAWMFGGVLSIILGCLVPAAAGRGGTSVPVSRRGGASGGDEPVEAAVQEAVELGVEVEVVAAG